ncbi:MAG: HAD-IA family hydrolase [Acidobacteria bacterium]|nr:HAD-IA family hydrolase [Acidobacteriota bacterium]
MTEPIRAITFDARGTLLHVRFPVGECYAAVARRHGAELSPDAIEKAFFDVFPGMPPLAFPPMPDGQLHDREGRWWRELVERVVEAADQKVDDFDAFFSELYTIYRGAEAWKPYREAASVLCLLRSAGYKLGLVSNFDSRIEQVLVALNLSIWFDSVVYSSRAGVAKPHLGIYERALAELDVKPDQALHVGDNLEKDWEAARLLGMDAVLIDRAGRYEGKTPAECEVIDSLESLLKRLGVTGFSLLARAHAS